jgi:DNA-binding NtrC family response regulator
MRGTVLVVDDQSGARRALAEELQDAGFSVVEASDGLEAWDRFRTDEPDLVITDMVMPRSDGIDLVSRIRARSETPVIIFTAYGSIDTAVAALKSGADEFVSSSDSNVDDLVNLIGEVLERGAEPDPCPEIDVRLAGTSSWIARVREQISGLAPLRTPVLVSGEPGSGRDTVVRALHELGSSAIGDLAVIRPDSPHRLGEGVGTCSAIYLDEVDCFGSREQELWAKRLQSARRSRFRTGPRILASAGSLLVSDDLGRGAGLVDQLARFHIELPPLRARPEDISHLATAFAMEVGRTIGRNRIRFSGDSIQLLSQQRWPGNVRQLRHALERAIAFCRSGILRRRDLEPVLHDLDDTLDAIRSQHVARERDAVLRAVREAAGNISRAAEKLGKSRAAVYRLLAKHGVALSRRR